MRSQSRYGRRKPSRVSSNVVWYRHASETNLKAVTNTTEQPFFSTAEAAHDARKVLPVPLFPMSVKMRFFVSGNLSQKIMR